MEILSPQAVTRLWDEQSAALVLYARQWCDAPEDIVQEAFLLLARQTVAPDNLVGWIYRVVRNRSINASRAKSRRSRRESVVSRREAWFDAAGDDRLDAAAASAVLKDLPLAEREAIVARLWGGLSFDEIARLTGTSMSSVYRNYQRGIATLRERLKSPCATKSSTAKK
jgi:RNA polymerase sigma-70 factor (ECF subfamily)